MMKLCEHCGKPVKDNRRRYCSRQCSGLARQNYRVCAVCGKAFPVPPSSEKRTCSPECSKTWQRLRGLSPHNVEQLIKSNHEYMASLVPEKQPAAKGWVLLSPDGKKYECVNLLNFFREHQNLIPGSPEAAAWGIVVVKQTLKGQRKRNKAYHWRGWRLLSWDDRNYSK